MISMLGLFFIGIDVLMIGSLVWVFLKPEPTNE